MRGEADRAAERVADLEAAGVREEEAVAGCVREALGERECSGVELPVGAC